MSTTRSGLFTVNEFRGRNILKIAPDAFVEINGALGSKVLSPANQDNYQNLEVRGGITSINVNLALKPSGASRATIEVIAPQYKGLHQDYYVTMPNGTRIPFFIPMMEVKIYMKGLYLDDKDGYKPKYYPVFWGLITDVSESYSGGVTTFSITCSDLLSWWKYQSITVRPSSVQAIMGAPTANKFPTVFENMTPWEIIYSLFMDTFFVQRGGAGGEDASFNFIYAKLSKSGISPDFEFAKNKDTFGALTNNVIKYWDARFGFGNSVDEKDSNRIPLEMYGLVGQIKVNTIRDDVLTFNSKARSARNSNINADLRLDYNMLARVQPYGAFNLYGDGAEPLVHTKLEIANEVCEQINFEFFVDSNGFFVFKPPFYNLDVRIPEYTVEPKDIINFNSVINSDNIVNFLEVTSPLYYEVPDLELIGYHIDYDSIKRFGLRYKNVAMRYGNDARTLSRIAAAEMSRLNGTAFTGSLSTPLRPELRLGYPVYIKHIDAYYYVTGITHSLTFGSAATTDLSLEFKRDRVFNDGSIKEGGKRIGDVLKGYVYRYRKDVEKIKGSLDNNDVIDLKAEGEKVLNSSNKLAALTEYNNLVAKDRYRKQNNLLAGPDSSGFYELSPAQQTVQKTDEVSDKGTENAIISNELVMITDETVPFTDKHGYKHIGAFPFGANLKLTKSDNLINFTDTKDIKNDQIDQVIGATGNGPDKSSRTTVEPPPPEEPFQQEGQGPADTFVERTWGPKPDTNTNPDINPDTNPEFFITPATSGPNKLKLVSDQVSSVLGIQGGN